MAHMCNTVRAKDTRHRVVFRTFSPVFQAVLAPTSALTGGGEGAAMQGGHTTARGTHHAMEAKARCLSACPQRTGGAYLSRKPVSSPPFCFFPPAPPEGRGGGGGISRASPPLPLEVSPSVTNRISESEERLEEAELEFELLELGRSAGPRFAEPEGAPTSAGPPGKPSVPSTIRRSRTMNRMASIERLRDRARWAAWRFALREALRRWRELGAAADAVGAAATGGVAAAAFLAPSATAGEGGCG